MRMGVPMEKAKRRTGMPFALKVAEDYRGLVPIMVGLVGAVGRDAKVIGLFLGELGELDADLLEVETGHFFVELLGQTIDVGFVEFLVRPEVELSQGLVGEGVRHDEARMAVGAAEIHET